MFKSRVLAGLVFAGFLLTSASFAASPDRIAGAVSGSQTVTLRGNVHPLAQLQFDRGPVDPTMQLGTITLLTAPTSAQQQALNQLLAQQQDPKSSNYHKWLTPEQYADRFGLSRNDIQQITAWLASEGFSNVQAARGRNWVSFTGTASQVENAFRTEIHHFDVRGELHYANSTAPAIPAALGSIVTGFRGLHDFHPHPMSQKRARPYWYSSTYKEDFVAPGDVATIYDLNALYTAGFDGTGQKLAVMGQTDIYLADINDFRAGFGLSSITCTTNTSGVITACSDPHFKYILDGTDPGVSAQGDLSEADLDLEWSGAVAKGAQIIYVNSGNTFDSFYYAIDNNTAPVISLSYGECEFFDNYINVPQPGQTLSNEAELQKANSEGITFVNSSGDSGAAECDNFSTVTSANLATQGLAVSYPASSPEVTGVGGTGTVFADWNNPTYWGTTNSSSGGTALSYVPEQAWNDDYEIYQYCTAPANVGNKFCTQGGTTAQPGWVSITSEATAQTDIGLSSTGGGASNCQTENAGLTACVSGFAKPSWQTVTVSGQTTRLSPDISFLASPNFPGYVFCTPLSELGVNSSTSSCSGGITSAVDTYLSIIGGTSASAPVFAGIVAVLNQYTSTTQGNINPSLYKLAATAPTAFHDVTSGDNKVYCVVGSPGTPQLATLDCPSGGVVGYSATSGFDLTTGLGSLDANAFAVALKSPPDFTASTPTTTLSVFAGQSGTATITVVPVNNFTGSVTFSCSGLPAGATCSFSPNAVTPPATTQTTVTIQTTGATSGTSTVVITASTGTLSQISHPAGSIALTTTAAFTMAPTTPSFQVAQGLAIDATVAVTLTNGFTGTISFTCTDTTSGSTCTAPPNVNTSGNVTFHVTTTAPTAKLQRPMDRGTRIFYAVLLPGLLGIVFAAGSSKRSQRGMRLLGLIVVLGMSTMWMASCGGNSGGGSTGNPGTPVGTYTINVSGASGGTTVPTSFQLVVVQ